MRLWTTIKLYIISLHTVIVGTNIHIRMYNICTYTCNVCTYVCTYWRKIQGFLQESGLEGKIIEMKGEGYIPVQNDEQGRNSCLWFQLLGLLTRWRLVTTATKMDASPY